MTESYEGLDDDEEFGTIPVVNNNNNVSVISNSNSDDNIKKDNKNFFDKDIDNEVKVTPPNHYHCKSGVCYEKAASFV